MRLLWASLAALVAMLVTPAGARAHWVAASEALERDSLYLTIAPPAAPDVQLQLSGYVSAAANSGYPVKVAIVNRGDITDRPALLRRPQRFAESVVTALGARHLQAPVLIITPYGAGLAGPELRDGRSRGLTQARAQQILRGFTVPAGASSDELAHAAMTAMRRVATAAARPLPEQIAPAQQISPVLPERGGYDLGGLAPVLVFFAVFGGAALLFETRARLKRRRRPASSTQLMVTEGP